ncbi:carbon-nitrogen hydrolase [Cytobacillus oceanisediminis]|uniref:Carbon-nitrogen hydrolase n=1 Tax=Cytobacillus oceanisediminis TaxID=665099 RepID=A0A2V2ZHU8_9BACI|nr:carbon-nitrogen hydrolase [Cytobacillus oceanisediminis]
MKLKIACLQMDIMFGKPKKNYEAAEAMIEKALKSNPDVIVLPELWTTGYDLTRLDDIGDQDAAAALTFLKGIAKKIMFIWWVDLLQIKLPMAFTILF